MTDPPDNLAAARALLDLAPPETESAAFHCQQAAEKYLKAFIALNGDEIPRIHDLTVLVDLAADYDSNLDDLEPHAEMLVPFAVAARYPFTHAEPDADEAEKAFQAATAIRAAVAPKTQPRTGH